jgi:hypothetical protein
MADTDLKIVRETALGGSIVRISGAIDTHFERRKLFEELRGVVVFDLDKVHRITSYGVREWLKGLGELNVDYYCFVGCRPAVMMQFNTVLNFGHRGELLTFYLPYMCEHCSKEVDVLLDCRKQFETVRALAPPVERCADCGNQLEFDDEPRTYFSHAAKARLPAPPALVDAIITGQALRASKQFEIHKDVRDSHTALWFLGPLDQSANLKRVGDGLEGTVLVIGDHLEGVTPEGLRKLATLAETAEAELVFARAPVPLATELARSAVFARCLLYSIWVKCACRKCRSELTLELRCGVRVERTELVCPDCRCPIDDPELDAALELAFSRKEVELGFEAETYLKIELRPPIGAALDDAIAGETFGRYQLVRPLATGGMAEVFLARQTSIAGFRKQVVIKRLPSHLAADAELVEMFLAQARLAARISHPNVVQIFDVGRERNQHFIAMEYVRGWDLSVVLRHLRDRAEPMPVQLAARVVSEICAALQAAHECLDEEGRPLTIIHRDVSPQNVLIAVDGRVKLTDFGIAHALGTPNRTPVNTLTGRLTYASPEERRGEALDVRADVYPAGLILRECATLVFRQLIPGPPARDATMVRAPIAPAAIPPALEKIVSRAIAEDRAKRQPTAAALRAELEALIDSIGQPASALELSVWLGARIPRQELLGLTPTAASPGASPTVIRSRPAS